jgi:ankyrin repeat protein
MKNIVRLFLTHGTDPNLLIDEDGEFFTYFLDKNLPKKFCIELIDLLIKFGLDVNLINEYNQNMGFNTNSTMLEILLKKALNANQIDCNGQQILNRVVTRFRDYTNDVFVTEDEILFDIQKQIKMLDYYNMNYNHKDELGNTIMHTLCKLNLDHKKQRDLFLYFYEKGASFNIENNEEEKAIVDMNNLSLYNLLVIAFEKKNKVLLDEVLCYIKPFEMEILQNEFEKIDPHNRMNKKIVDYIKLRNNSILQTLKHKICADVVKYEICKLVYP